MQFKSKAKFIFIEFKLNTFSRKALNSSIILIIIIILNFIVIC